MINERERFDLADKLREMYGPYCPDLSPTPHLSGCDCCDEADMPAFTIIALGIGLGLLIGDVVRWIARRVFA